MSLNQLTLNKEKNWLNIRVNSNKIDKQIQIAESDGSFTVDNNFGSIYPKADKQLYWKDEDQVEKLILSGPASSSFISEDSNAFPNQKRSGTQANNSIGLNSDLTTYSTTETGAANLGLVIGSEVADKLAQFVAIKHQDANEEPAYVMIRTRGTEAAQTGVQANDKIGAIYGISYNDNNVYEVNGILQFEAVSNQTATNADARFVVRLTETNNVTTSEAFIIDQDASIALRETIASGPLLGFGKFYVKSSDSLPYFKDSSGTEYSLINTDTSIYNADGTLTGVRTVDQNTNDLSFTNGTTNIDNLNIAVLPPTDNTENAILVRDSVSGNIEIRDATSIGGSGSLQDAYDNSSPTANIDLSWEFPGGITITDPDDTNNILFKVSDSTGIREYLNVRAGQFSAATNTGFVGVSNGAVVGNNSSLTNCSDSYIYGKDSLMTLASDSYILGSNNNVNQTAGSSTNVVVCGNRNDVNETSLIAPYNSAIIGFDNTGDDCDNNFIFGQDNTSNGSNNVIIGRNINTAVNTVATSINFNVSDVGASPLVNESANFFHMRSGFGIFDRTDNRDFNTTDGNASWYTQSNFITDIQTGITVVIDTLPFRTSAVNNTFLLVSDNVIYRDDQNDTDPEHVRTEGLCTWRDDTLTLAVISTTNTVVRAGSYAQNPAFVISGDNIQLTFPANAPATGITYRVQSVCKLVVGNSPRI